MHENIKNSDVHVGCPNKDLHLVCHSFNLFGIVCLELAHEPSQQGLHTMLLVSHILL